MASEIPDYESYDYTRVWKGRGLEDMAEREVVRRYAAGSERHGTALELGGGFGRITQTLEPVFQRVFMIDYSLSALRRAARVLRKTTLVRSGLESLPFEDNTFDFVTMVRVMQHIPDPYRLLGEVARVARPGGMFILGIANEAFTGYGRVTEHTLGWTTPEGHRVYVTPLSRYGSAALRRQEVRGVGVFDNRLGRRLDRLEGLSSLDVATARLWPVKTMLFARFSVEKAGGVPDFREPSVLCPCGGRFDASSGRCGSCQRRTREDGIIDLVSEETVVAR